MSFVSHNCIADSSVNVRFSYILISLGTQMQTNEETYKVLRLSVSGTKLTVFLALSSNLLKFSFYQDKSYIVL